MKRGKYPPEQALLPLLQPVTKQEACTTVCLPDRTSAECRVTELKRELGANFIKANINKDRSKSGNGSFSVRYYYLRTTDEKLFT